jgi:hypothetical protein
LPRSHAYTLEPGRPTPGRHNLLRPPIASRIGAGILTRFPSTTALALVLGADSPCADARGAGNLGLTASRTFTCFIATHVSIRTSDTSSKGHPSPSTAYGTLSYRLRNSLKSPPPRHGVRPRHRHPVPFGTGRIIGIRFRLEPAESSASGSVWNRPPRRWDCTGLGRALRRLTSQSEVSLVQARAMSLVNCANPRFRCLA